ncbi:Venom allergen 3 [Cyphomyrmex costatus]|uniref:Venom allergen 3 n=2 Tax=Cyphomyrmex costatus TaxID=456900 RepID=A0A151ID92_9HYME|nr:Venom allergen 3 [Cyphomyrmex costatus]
MPNLVWDKELEQICQTWVNQCVFGHDECRNVDRFTVGQNMAQTSYSGKNTATVVSMVDMWYNEVNDFNNTEVEKYRFDTKTGHYTQIIWANSLGLGCAQMQYKKPNGWNVKNLCCNYGPHGNMQGSKIYAIKK